MRLILAFSIPLLLGNVLQQMYNMVDSIVVGNYVGTTALAAVGTGFPIIYMMVALFMGIGNGATVIISQYFGAGNLKKVSDTVDTIYTTGIVGALPISVIGILLSGPLLRLINTPDNTFFDARLYMIIIFAGTIFSLGYNLNSEIFGDQVVREAISSAIDKDAVVENIYGGLLNKADTFFSRDLPYCDVEQTVYGFDLDHANQILDEAGYVDTDGDGIREKNGAKLSAAFLYQTGTASDDNMVVYICDQASKIGIELTPQSAQMMDWYAMIQSGDYGLTIFKTQGGYYDPAMVITNINPSTSMDPILMQIGASQPELAVLVDELDSATDEARIQEIYNTILTTMADQCLTTPLIYTRQLAIYSDAVASYTFPTDASFTSVQNIHLN